MAGCHDTQEGSRRHTEWTFAIPRTQRIESTMSFHQLESAIECFAATCGIHVSHGELPPGTVGEFTGTTVTMNSTYPVDERVYYLVHALGSIVLWSLDRQAVQRMFDQLRAAKEHKDRDPAELERRIRAFRDFETESSELGASMLSELGFPEAVGSYTNFMRADLESITQFHRTGTAPVWREFFARWNDDVAAGRRTVEPYTPRPVPGFQAVPIERQEILQAQSEQQ